MKLEFTYCESRYTVEFDDVLIISSPNQKECSEILNIIKDMFLGKRKDSFVNNLSVSKSEYEVYVASKDSTINNEFKFSSKSLLLPVVTKCMANVDEDEKSRLINSMNELLLPLHNDLKNSFNAVLGIGDSAYVDICIKDLMSMVIDNK